MSLKATREHESLELAERLLRSVFRCELNVALGWLDLTAVVSGADISGHDGALSAIASQPELPGRPCVAAPLLRALIG